MPRLPVSDTALTANVDPKEILSVRVYFVVNLRLRIVVLTCCGIPEFSFLSAIVILNEYRVSIVSLSVGKNLILSSFLTADEGPLLRYFNHGKFLMSHPPLIKRCLAASKVKFPSNSLSFPVDELLTGARP